MWNSEVLAAALFCTALIPAFVWMFFRTVIAFWEQECRTKWVMLTAIHMYIVFVVARYYDIPIFWPLWS